jgi:S-DNA-T family DNA segregation ATPase FtsK/SpoIIIE
MRNKLEFQADRIEAVLALNKVPARVTGGTVTPRWVRFQILPAVGAKISKIKSLSEEMAAALNASNCRVSRRGAAVSVEVPRDDPEPVRLLPLYNQLIDDVSDQLPIPPVTAVLGLAEDGAPLLIRLPSPDVAHVLLAGTTGSGKTMLLQAMILSLAMANPPALRGEMGGGISLVLIDPKGLAFRFFEGLPHLARPVIWEMKEMTEVLRSLVRLMERRSSYGRIGRNGNTGPQPPVVVVIDELADLLMVGEKEVQWALTRLTQRGREAGIHIVAATQKPTAAVLGPLVKANFPVRLVGRVTSAEDARTATGWSGTGAERLMGRGDFLAVAEGRVIRFQAAHISSAEIQKVVTSLQDGGWQVTDGRWGEALPAIPSLVPSRQSSLSRPVGWLTDVFREENVESTTTG